MDMHTVFQEIEILKLSCDVALRKCTDHTETVKLVGQKHILDVLKRKLEYKEKQFIEAMADHYAQQADGHKETQ